MTNTVGTGKTLLSAYPLEHYLANVPAVFDKPEGTHRIYAAFRDWAGVKPELRADLPSVEVSALKGDHRGYAVVVNHSAETQEIKISASSTLRSATRILPEGRQPLKIEGSGWRMELSPFEGAVVEWNQ